jgi:hypothetical protein
MLASRSICYLLLMIVEIVLATLTFSDLPIVDLGYVGFKSTALSVID